MISCIVDIIESVFFAHLKMPSILDKRIELITETDSTEPIIKFKFEKYELEKNSENDMFYVNSIQKLLNRYDNTLVSIKNFIQTNIFYQMLCFIDKSLPKYGFVYLLIDEEMKRCKIGKTFNFDKRYTKSKTKLLDRLVPVKNDKSVENKLLNFFRTHYHIVDGMNETFEYTNIRTVRSDFNKIVEQYKIDVNYKTSIHLSNDRFSQSRQGLWCTYQVTDLILNYYIEDCKERAKINSMLKLINLSINKDSYQFIQYDSKYKTNIIYMKFHKYTIIGREIDKYVNGSRLYNSIIKADKRRKKYNSFRLFMERGPMHKWVERFNEEFPDLIPYQFLENEENKYLEGYYVHPLLIHFIVEELDTKYAFAMSQLMFKLNNPSQEIDMTINLNTEHFRSFAMLIDALHKIEPRFRFQMNMVI